MIDRPALARRRAWLPLLLIALVGLLLATSVAGSAGAQTSSLSITSLSRSDGPASGGNVISIRGDGLDGVDRVWFGQIELDEGDFAYVEENPADLPPGATPDRWLDVVAPTAAFAPGTLINIKVGAGSLLATAPYYIKPVWVSEVEPSSGPLQGGNAVTIRGEGFSAATAVRFGGTSVPSDGFTVVSDTEIVAQVPTAGASTWVNAVVEVDHGSSTATSTGWEGSWYVYQQPGFQPNRGTPRGGTTVVLRGAGYEDVTRVRFGPPTNGVDAASFTIDSDTQITAVAPPATSGALAPGVLVSLWTYDPGVGWSKVDDGDPAPGPTFYYDRVDVAEVSPSVGSTTSPTTVTITGVGLDEAAVVRFGVTRSAGAQPVDVTVAPGAVNAAGTQLTVTVPPQDQGGDIGDSGEVVVLDALGNQVSSATMAGRFTWVGAVEGYSTLAPGGAERLAVVGDSITAQAVTELHSRFDGTYRTSVTGRSGYRVEELDGWVDQYLAGGSPDRVVINLGTNDKLQYRAGPPDPSIVPAASAADLAAMHQRFVQTTDCIVLVTVNRSALGEASAPVADAINAEIVDLAQSSGGSTVVADWSSHVADHVANPPAAPWFKDTVHPNTAGRGELVDLIEGALAGCPS